MIHHSVDRRSSCDVPYALRGVADCTGMPTNDSDEMCRKRNSRIRSTSILIVSSKDNSGGL